MNRFKQCIKKECIDLLRSKKLLVAFAILFSLLILLLLGSKLVPWIVDVLRQEGDFLADVSSVVAMLDEILPRDLQLNCAVFAADVGLFYAVIVVFLTFGLIPGEIKMGRLILPVCAGYTRRELFSSKLVVYSIGLSLPVFPMYMFYYLFAATMFDRNFQPQHALINALLLTFGVFVHVNLTIAMSMMYKHKIATLFTMLGFVVVLPEIMARLPWGQYFPTHVYTYAYNSLTSPEEIGIPMLEIVVIVALVDFIALNYKGIKIVDASRA